MARPARTILLLDGVPDLPLPDGWCSLRVEGPLTAASVLASTPPSAVVVSGAAWERAMVASIPPAQRPAVVLHGGGETAAPQWVDEWIASDAPKEEIPLRLKLACQRARLRRSAARRGLVDPLTRVPNRRAVIRGLVREASRCRRTGLPLSLVLLDLDEFKEVNERRGHPEGDRLLRRVGAVLRAHVREGELCGRIGGDEFAVVVAAGEAEAARTAARIREALAAAGISASVASCTLREGERLRELYRRTDGRLAAEKRKRRLNRVPRGSSARTSTSTRRSPTQTIVPSLHIGTAVPMDT